MKKLFLGAAIAVSSLSFAQQFGIKGGMNVSSVSENDAKSKIGFYAGAFANVPVAKSFSIQPEILYTQYGAKHEETTPGMTLSYTAKLDYIAVPVMFQYNATPEFFLEAGPEFGFLVSAKTKSEAVVSGVKASNTENIKSELNGFNFGLGLGAGYYFTKNIGITARYVAGFTDIAKDNSGDAVKNNNFQVGLAYKF